MPHHYLHSIHDMVLRQLVAAQFEILFATIQRDFLFKKKIMYSHSSSNTNGKNEPPLESTIDESSTGTH